MKNRRIKSVVDLPLQLTRVNKLCKLWCYGRVIWATLNCTVLSEMVLLLHNSLIMASHIFNSNTNPKLQNMWGSRAKMQWTDMKWATDGWNRWGEENNTIELSRRGIWADFSAAVSIIINHSFVLKRRAPQKQVPITAHYTEIYHGLYIPIHLYTSQTIRTSSDFVQQRIWCGAVQLHSIIFPDFLKEEII